MKYLFKGLLWLIAGFFTAIGYLLYLISQFAIIVWHLNIKHCFDFDTFLAFGKAQSQNNEMLRWTIIFLILAVISAIFGFGGVAGEAAGIAKILFFIFLTLFVLSLIAAPSTSEEY